MYIAVIIINAIIIVIDLLSNVGEEISLSGTVLTANWQPNPDLIVEFYTLSCSINHKEVVSVDTNETSLVVGIYEPNETYVCYVRYMTTQGVSGPATATYKLTTGGEHTLKLSTYIIL